MKSLQLTWLVRDEIILVTTPEAAENELEVRIYTCRDFLEIPSSSKHKDQTLDRLINVIKSVIEPLSWDDQGGSGTIQSLPGGILVISATSRVHAQVEQLLEKVRVAKKVGLNAVNLQASQISATEQKLQQRIDVTFFDTPLKDVIDTIKSKLDIPIMIDERALTEVGLDSSTIVNIDLRNIKAEIALDLTMESLQLTWLVRDEIMLVTTPEAEENELEVRLYTCRDFLEIPSSSKHKDQTLDRLIDVIKYVIEPRSWVELGGTGVRQSLPGGILVISASSRVHAQVEQLLEKLRVAKKVKLGTINHSRELPMVQLDGVAIPNEGDINIIINPTPRPSSVPATDNPFR
jgi:hypothetical protein